MITSLEPRISNPVSLMSRFPKSLLVALLGIGVAAALGWDWYNAFPPNARDKAKFVGTATCASCHQAEHSLWLGSDHERAMDLATEKSVLGDFNDTSFTRNGATTRFFRRDGKFFVNTEGPDGKYQDFEIKYTFGVRPLQQYMVEFPDGRVQVLRVSWDTEKKEWFEVTPPDVPDERLEAGDPLHWTGVMQNWNTTCADCHSTNIHKNYDPKTNTYRTTFEEINVGCEECHGPGSVHVALANSWSPFWDRNVGFGLARLKGKDSTTQIELCAKCHSRRFQVHEDFRAGEPLLDFYQPFTLNETLYHADGQILDEVYEYGSFLQSKMFANHVKCTDCHNPHSLKLKFEGNRLCSQCHDPAKFDTPAHHHHAENSAGAKCVECHMPSRYYMVVDKRRDHSFRIPRPDLSVEFGTPNACTDCHKGAHETNQWATDSIRKWFGEKRREVPDWAPAFAAAREGKPEGEALLLELIDRKATPAIVRATAISLLAGYSSEKSLEVRRKATTDLDALVRASAVRSLANQSPQRVLADLTRPLHDARLAVRVAAAAQVAYLPFDALADADRAAFEDSLKEFRETQEFALDHAGAHLSLSELEAQQGHWEKAINHLQAALQLEPSSAGARGKLASILAEHEGDPKEIRRLREEEAELMERDSQRVPDNAEVVYQLGLLRYLLGQYDAADAAFTRAWHLGPQTYEYGMALALLEEKLYELKSDEVHFKDAVETLKQLNQLRPSDPRAGQILDRIVASRRAKQVEALNPNPQGKE